MKCTLRLVYVVCGTRRGCVVVTSSEDIVRLSRAVCRVCPVMCGAALWATGKRGETRLGGNPPGRAGGGRNAGLRGSRLTVFPRCRSPRYGVFSCARMDVVHKMRQRCRQPLGWGCGRGDGGSKAAVCCAIRKRRGRRFNSNYSGLALQCFDGSWRSLSLGFGYH